MTRDEVLSMEAGPRLDDLVCRVVFGEELDAFGGPTVIVRDGNIVGNVPPYSTDWHAAGQLMEAVNSRFYYPEWHLEYGDGLSMKPNNPQRGVWWVRFSGKTSESLDEPGIYCPAYGLTGPHGIGLAAVLAFLPEVGGATS